MFCLLIFLLLESVFVSLVLLKNSIAALISNEKFDIYLDYLHGYILSHKTVIQLKSIWKYMITNIANTPILTTTRPV